MTPVVFLRNPKLLSDLKSDLESKSYDVVQKSNWWAIRLLISLKTIALHVVMYRLICIILQHYCPFGFNC